ncbi:protein NPGR2-like [Juglans microcarpa x Juglans regia]|uniref:protein NPGR2-like n=1 Tax=Juglans microcarpa x Juglans regia TaxID=2249226 RepID=UPI001B7ECB73|nr:protein NPGR2-like [Juglans microcarpa x Juglans regia]XP_041004687.1 protein NPGR2-like [Juglans microcarpa x Juglans regia]XP_041004688.1 protein NPGR2-like [Juglans microcarpa x Juglans regia]
MRSKNRIGKRRGRELGRKLGKIVKCICSGEQFSAVDEMAPSSESLAIKNYSESADSLKAVEVEKKLDTGNIEEAESSLRESGCLNYEEARALLGRYEYQKGNIEAALHVFEGIDIAVVTPKIKVALSRKGEHHKRRSQNFANPPMSIHAVSLLLEAIFLKAKSLQGLGRFKEAAQSCKVILDIVESSLPGGLPENFGADCKLQETLNKAVELLPELWKLADSPHEAILSYRQALLHHWNLDAVIAAKIQKEFAIFLLYSGGEASPPNLRSQMDSSFIPRNNIEEAILLLMILLRKVSLKRIEWDPSILDHLSFALSVAGDLRALANQVEELPPGIINRKDRYHTLALCYCGAGEDLVAINLLRKLLNGSEDPKCLPALLLASKICGENPNLAEEGISFACRALESLGCGCNQLESIANFLLGVSLSAHSKSAVADSDRASRQSETVQALETAGKMTRLNDPNILYHLSLENADQRKLDAALYYAKRLLILEGSCNVHGWLLLARILSAKKQFIEAETVINAALDETGKWDQGELLRTKAKLQIAQGQLKIAIDTYTQLLAILQVQRKSFGSGKKLIKSSKTPAKSLEVEVWHDLAYLYISLSQWHDAEICLSKSKAICSYSASRCHATGVLYEGKGLYKEALKAFADALEIDPTHVPSLISVAVVLRQLGNPSHAVVRSFLMNALQLDRMNHSAWYNLGLLYKAEGTASSLLEATEYFEAATLLEESAPIEPFR